MQTVSRSERSFSFIGALCFVFLILLTPALALEKITVGWESWEPYSYADEKQQMLGLDVEIITAAAKNAGFEVEFKEYPWKRILHNIETGELDLTCGASKTAEREVYANFTEPYRTESAVLFVRKGTAGNFPFKELKDIIPATFQLGVETEYFYGDKYAELMKKEEFAKHVETVNRAELNYNKLLKGRIQGFLTDPFAGAAYLKKNNLTDQIETHPMPVYSDAIHFMISKKTQKVNLVQQLNDAIKKMKADGSLEVILNKWR